MRTAHKTCNLCEATCGLLIDVKDNQVQAIRADREDPFSRGHICPKAFALKEIHEDPDRLRFPVKRTPSGGFERISWEQAFHEAALGIARVQQEHGRDALASYYGNPAGHNLGTMLYLLPFLQTLGTRNRYAVGSVDQNPRLAASLFLYGSSTTVPVPDIDRTHFMLMLGANPLASNGSAMTAPDVRGRLRALRQRGGRLVVVDPRRTETARHADEHMAIRPGLDGLLMAALVHTVIEEQLIERSPAFDRVVGLEALRAALRPLSPEAVAQRLQMSAVRIRQLAQDFAAAPSAVCYGRVGTCLHPHGTLVSWLIDVLNLLTGNLDSPGGAMFTTPAVDPAPLVVRMAGGGHSARFHSRVRGLPELNDELPVACLAEEITTEGQGQVRGLVTIAGNPVLSTPNGSQLDRALAQLEHYVAVDIYINETTRHADLILPPAWSLEADNYQLVFHLVAVRNTAKFSPRVVEPEPGMLEDWQILSELSQSIERARNPGPYTEVRTELMQRLSPSPRTALDALLRAGPYGDQFVPWRRGLRLDDLLEQPSGVDLGPLQRRLKHVVYTPDGELNLGHEKMLAELSRITAHRPEDGLVLIGRRQLRSNNSWLHNAPSMVSGRPRCTLLMHPDDAAQKGLKDGDTARVESRVGQVEVPVAVSDEVMPGVVSLPHGWGHHRPGARLRVAEQQPGVSLNDLTDEQRVEPVTGNAILNGTPVEVSPAQ